METLCTHTVKGNMAPIRLSQRQRHNCSRDWNWRFVKARRARRVSQSRAHQLSNSGRASQSEVYRKRAPASADAYRTGGTEDIGSNQTRERSSLTDYIAPRRVASTGRQRAETKRFREPDSKRLKCRSPLCCGRAMYVDAS